MESDLEINSETQEEKHMATNKSRKPAKGKKGKGDGDFKPIAPCWHGQFTDRETPCFTDSPILQLTEKQMHKITFDKFFDLAKKSGYEVWIDLKAKTPAQVACEEAERKIAERLGAKKVRLVTKCEDIRINFFD